uniref:ORF23 n=1 Tax=Nitrosopumilaceae spindle-shaped virus TaxID=3065433 RepID=A0AAT9JA84_9VIRU
MNGLFGFFIFVFLPCLGIFIFTQRETIWELIKPIKHSEDMTDKESTS